MGVKGDWARPKGPKYSERWTQTFGKKDKDVLCGKCGGLICNGLAGDETFRVCEDCGRMDCE